MCDFNAMWKRRWRESRSYTFCQQFNIQNFINVHYNTNNTLEWKIRCRDFEMLRLENVDTFNPNLREGGDETTTPVFSCKFCPLFGYENVVASVTEHGHVYVLKSVGRKLETTSTKAHNNAVFDLSWVPGEKKFLTLSGDLTARLWDVGQESIRLTSVFVGHTKSVKAADFMPDNAAIFASGSRDGNIHIWDTRSCKGVDNQFKPDQTITLAAHSQRKGRLRHSAASVTALVFRDSHNLLCSGSTDECIRIWDMRKTHCAWKLSEPKGFLRSGKSGYTDLKLNRERTKLYASCINSSIFSFNINSIEESPIAEFKGHHCGSFYIKICVSNDGAYLASGSMDKNIYVWKTKSAELQEYPRDYMFYLSGHEAEVTGVDFNQTIGNMVVSCGDDGTVRTWKPKSCVSEESIQPISQNVTIFDEVTPSLLSKCHNLHISPKRLTNEIVPLIRTEQREVTPPRRVVRPSELSTSLKRKFHETSPVRSNDSKRGILSPSKSNYRSPTLNLPNYVLEGTGPSHSCPSLKQKENKNWLMEMRERSAGKQSLSADKCGRRQRTTNGHRSSRKTLLEYYKKCGKTIDDSQKK